MKKYITGFLAAVLLLSIGLNVYQYQERSRAEEQLTQVNERVMGNIEQYLRWTVRYLNELVNLQETPGYDLQEERIAFENLQNASDSLVENYLYFIEIRDDEGLEEGVCIEVLDSLRSFRNIINQSLETKYLIHEERFTRNDHLFLREAQFHMEGFSQGFQTLRDNNQGGLSILLDEDETEAFQELADNLNQLISRYRHSNLTNNGDPISRVRAEGLIFEWINRWKDFEELSDLLSEEVEVLHRNGVSAYTYQNENVNLWIDQYSGRLRFMEVHPEVLSSSKRDLGLNTFEAYQIALEFIEEVKEMNGEVDGNNNGNSFAEQEYRRAVFDFTHSETGEVIYAFRLVPIQRSIYRSCDAYEIAISGKTGEILRYRNRFNSTRIPADESLDIFLGERDEFRYYMLSANELQEMHREEFGEMDYLGRALIRNYYTEFYPRLVKIFGTDIEGQNTVLYFDELSGFELERGYYPYDEF